MFSHCNKQAGLFRFSITDSSLKKGGLLIFEELDQLLNFLVHSFGYSWDLALRYKTHL